MNKWTQRFLDLAMLVASWSKDPSTKCGAVIVDSHNRIVSLGYNGLPTGIDDTVVRLEDRRVKLKMVRHAEMNAIQFARRDMYDCTMYVWPVPPCAQCAGAIIQAGIGRVVAPAPDSDFASRWADDLALMKDMFREARILFVEIERCNYVTPIQEEKNG